MKISVTSIFMFFSLIYSISLIIIYLSKKRIDSIETQIYKRMIIYNCIGIIIQIICEILLSSNIPSNSIFIIITSKLLLAYFLIWLSLMFYYVIQISISKDKSLKKFYILSSIVFSIIVMILPIELFADNVKGMYYSYGAGPDFTYFASAIIMIIITILTVVFIKKITNKKAIPIILLLILMLISGIIQKQQPSITILVGIETFIGVIMYFTIENPDLKMIEELNIAKAEAERANLAKTDFLSSMSHEIRTPLNAITGFSHAMLDIDNLPADAINYANDIIKSSDTLLEIVGGVLDVSKIESDRMELAEVIYNPVEEFEDLARMAKSRIGEKPIMFNWNFAEDIPYQLYGDKVNMKKIVTNLLTNAVKYTNQGHIIFNVRCINTEDTSSLIISVQDSGRGIKEEAISKLFTKFERLGMDRNTTTEGTGLGLAITKKLVELMNGKINVKSQYGVGSIFVAQIPQKICKQSKPLTDTQILSTLEIQKRAQEIENSFAGRKILIVDDNALNIKVAKISLKKLNFETESVSSGEECIDLIKSGNKYDLILMDIMMPNMGGEECFKLLKEIPEFRTPVIALTADAVSGSKEKYIEQGFNSYIAKPFSPDEIKAELINIFKNYK